MNGNPTPEEIAEAIVILRDFALGSLEHPRFDVETAIDVLDNADVFVGIDMGRI